MLCLVRLFTRYHTRRLLLDQFVAELRGRCGRERLTPNLLNQRRKTAVTSRKESDWNEANQQSVMNSFSLQALFPSPTKENKTKQDTCTLPLNWRGKQGRRRLLMRPELISVLLPDIKLSQSGFSSCLCGVGASCWLWLLIQWVSRFTEPKM